ncbi:DUF6867 family protein [Paraburkholderia youngii]|uniref:DUF6867 family protein n=1 Tax=Paraburkholderia youngii TaxID=2782701 RepID=UPI003D19E4B9
MSGVIYEASSPLVFILFTVIFGGLAAYRSGQAAAWAWRPVWWPLIYALAISGAVRFLHFALFQETLLSIHYFCVDFATLLIFAVLGWRIARVRQMTKQYRWLYENNGTFAWRTRETQE